MSRFAMTLKSRVRYEGLARTTDRRPNQGADFEKLPDPIWYIMGQVLRSKFRKPILGRKGKAKSAPKPAVVG